MLHLLVLFCRKMFKYIQDITEDVEEETNQEDDEIKKMTNKEDDNKRR